jgi:tetratricopeptide (TPR) repeat protein
VLQRQGELDAAVASYRTALSLSPRSVEALYGLATALQSQGKPIEAAQYFRGALSLSPDLAEAHADLGDALNAIGRPDEAVASYRRALALKQTPEFRSRFARGIGLGKLLHADPDLRDLVARALSEPWARP